jgi:hypothetical protein
MGIHGRAIAPNLGYLELDDVRIVDVQKMVLSQTPYNARLCLMVPKTLCREARTIGMTEKNPTLGVKLHKLPEPNPSFLTWDQVDALDGLRFNSQVRFLALHGLRRNETLAIESEDIWDGFMHVNKSVYGNTKGESSNKQGPYIGTS